MRMSIVNRTLSPSPIIAWVYSLFKQLPLSLDYEVSMAKLLTCFCIENKENKEKQWSCWCWKKREKTLKKERKTIIISRKSEGLRWQGPFEAWATGWSLWGDKVIGKTFPQLTANNEASESNLSHGSSNSLNMGTLSTSTLRRDLMFWWV